MGFLDKLMFWKKDEDLAAGGKDANLGLDTGLGKDLGMGTGFGGQDNLGIGGQGMGLPGTQPPPQDGFGGFGQNAPFGNRAQQQQMPPQTAPPGFQAAQSVPVMPQQPVQQEFTIVSKDIELLSYKLDTLKAALDMVNQRLANIERLAAGEQERRKNW